MSPFLGLKVRLPYSDLVSVLSTCCKPFSKTNCGSNTMDNPNLCPSYPSEDHGCGHCFHLLQKKKIDNSILHFLKNPTFLQNTNSPIRVLTLYLQEVAEHHLGHDPGRQKQREFPLDEVFEIFTK